MAAKKPRRTVYSTELGKVCPRCGWPDKNCTCSTRRDEVVPDRILVRLRIEKAGRKGKTVTVVEGLPRNRDFLRELAAELKRSCGTGGKAAADRVEIQGDHREKLRRLLSAKGWQVKG
jgi:translation initiation factor 1